jgi:hypothetical protein
MSLEVTISNGDPKHNSRLRFDYFNPNSPTPRVWLARVPRLRNADAFPRQVGRHRWVLMLDAVNETQPLEVVSYSPENADQWVNAANRTQPPHTEILIMASKKQFTITLLEHK